MKPMQDLQQYSHKGLQAFAGRIVEVVAVDHSVHQKYQRGRLWNSQLQLECFVAAE